MDQLERIGKYQVVRPLGQGGFGEVFLVRHPELAVLRAVKMLRFGTEGHKLEEAVLQAQLEHERIVRCMDVGVQEGRPYLVMEYLPGGSLADLLDNGPLDLQRALNITRDLALALAHAHSQNVIHRDLKPANVLLTEDGRAKIGDFGLARLLDQGDSHQTKLAGTVAYLAPEQVTGEAGPLSDLWSLGCLLYEMIAGRPPFLNDADFHTMRAIVESEPDPLAAPPEVASLVLALLSKDPAARPASAQEVARRLAPLIAPSANSAPKRVGPMTMVSDDWPTLGGDAGRTSAKLPGLGRRLGELWRFEAPSAVVSQPALCRSKLIFGCTEGQVICLDLVNGKQAWSYDCGANAFPPVVAMGTACLAVSYDGTAHALGVAGGQSIWRAKPGHEVAAAPLMSPAGVVVADMNGGVYVLGSADGETSAYWDLGAPIEAAPLWTGQLVVAVTTTGLAAGLDPASGKMVWSRDLGQAVEAAPTLGQGSLFVLGREGELHCLDVGSGTERWRTQASGPAVASPVVDENGLLIVDLDGRVFSLDRADGRQRWQRRLAAPLSAAPALAGGLAVLADRAGSLTLIDRAEGEEVLRLDLGAPFAASPLVWREVVITAAVDGVVCALGPGE